MPCDTRVAMPIVCRVADPPVVTCILPDANRTSQRQCAATAHVASVEVTALSVSSSNSERSVRLSTDQTLLAVIRWCQAFGY